MVAVVPGHRCEDTYWTWSLTGLLRFGEVGGGCMTSTSGQDKIYIKPCEVDREDQLVEAGLDVEVDGLYARQRRAALVSKGAEVIIDCDSE